MKYYALIFAIIVVIFVPVMARTGGPDYYGYTFSDSDEPDVEFSWIDYSDATEIDIPPGTDDMAYSLTIPFDFLFYGENYDTILVSTNGLLSFNSADAEEYNNVEIPSPSLPNAVIAPLWDDQRYYDIDTVETAIYYYTGGTEPERFFCITYVKYFHYGFYDDTWTYQTILYEQPDSSDGKIAFQYLDASLEGSGSSTYGGTATVGIENDAGTIGLQYLYEEPLLSDSLRIEFEPPEVHNHDVAAISILEPAGIVISERGNMPRCVIFNMGISDESAVDNYLRIVGDSAGEVYNEHISTVLNAGMADTVEFPEWSHFPADSYTIIFCVSITDDEVPSNDTIYARVEGREHIGYGGPDIMGYMWYDNLYVGDEAPEFIPISLSGATELDLSGDDDTMSVELPFTFPFYDELFDTIWISTNGFISFGPITTSHYSNQSLPTDVFNGVIAPFWDDLNIRSSGVVPHSQIYTLAELAKDGLQRFHIIFMNAYVPPFSTTDYLTFEIVLTDSGEIYLQYTGLFGLDDFERVSGSSATVGISSPDGSSGLMYEFNGDPIENPIFDDFVIEFVPPVDTIPPNIVHTADTLRYLCAADGFTLQLAVDITDSGGVMAETLFYFTGLTPTPAMLDDVIGDTYYFKLLGLSEGESFSYYIKAVDNSNNTSYLPAGAPGEQFHTYIGNPHNGGDDIYSFSDNFADESSYPAPPDFEWIELDPAEGGSGTEIADVEDDWISDTITVDGGIWHMEIGSLYPYIKICSNGWITFDMSETTPFTNGEIPSSDAPNNIIAGLWTDLTPIPPDTGLPYGRIFYGYIDTTLASIDRMLIVEWKDFYCSGDISGEPATFQIRMGIFSYSYTSYANFETSVHYLSIPNSCRNNVTIGIEDDSGLFGLAYINDGFPDACLPTDSSAVDIYNGLINISEKMPKYIQIGSPYPNPFNSSVSIALNLPYAQHISADIISLAGRKVAQLANGIFYAGSHSIKWSPKSEMPSGIYFIRIDSDNGMYMKKIFLTK